MQIICHGLKEEDFPVKFTGHKIFFGGDDSNDIVVKADGVSKYHAFLVEEEGELYLQDNDSLNGTFLNNDRIRDRRKLAQGDIIQIGYRLIKVDFLSAQKAVLDFVPPEQTEIIPQESMDATLVSRTVQQTLPDGGDGHTVVMSSETQSSAFSANTIFSSGAEIGKYVIVKRIGKGGMGEVYLARHKTIGTFRALKVLSKDLMGDNAKFLERFIREAKLASDIRHPNVVGVMDVETDPACGVPYIVMEYVDGGSLRNSLTVSKRLSEEQAVVIVEAVASALQAAEEHNIVHRDIKPDNIMFTKRGEVKLADLGIAKGDGKDNDLTKTNMMIGTPAYLPPEQAQNAKGVDARADIYSLGATFYEMLTGETPFSGDSTIEILHKLILNPVPDPRKINPGVSAASAAIVMKMLAKDPKERFQSATELLDVMERTFPPHTAHEAGELIKKVIAGDCQSNTEFSSGISSSHFSLWWLKIPHKGLVISATALVFAICALCILFLFFGRHPAARSLPDAGQLYSLQIKTTPDADIQLFFPDGQSKMFSSGSDGVFTLPGQGAGKYKVWIARTGFNMRTQDFELNDDISLDLPLFGAIIPGPIMTIADDDEQEPNAIPIDNLLVVSTDRDVVDPDDGVTSLREAIDYARRLGSNATVSFAKDCEIRLSSSLVISKDVEIDGEGNNITIIGPETEQMFHVSEVKLTLKNMTLVSDRSGEGAGIIDASSCKINLFSVKDEGKAECLWKMTQALTKLDGACHLHRVHFFGSDFVQLGISPESVLEDSVFSGLIVCDVRGLLKNTSALNLSRICVLDGGTGENLTIGKGFIEHWAGGTINGLKVEFDSVYGHEKDAVLTGTVIIGGTAFKTGNDKDSIVGDKTDIILDLTARTEESKLTSLSTGLLFGGKKSLLPCRRLLEDMNSFRGAHSYTVCMREDQTSGSYKLATNAMDFNSPVSLKIGDKLYPDALAVGKPFSLGSRTYALERSDSDGITNNVLNLVIQGGADLKTEQQSKERPHEKTTVIFEGTVDGEGTFVFRENKVFYNHNRFSYPEDVTINGKAWENLDEPFDLGFKPFFPSAEIVEKEGRNIISLKAFKDFAELYINDSALSSSHYKVKISF